jgi:hypothetical protein
MESLNCIETCSKELTNRKDLLQKFIQHNGTQFFNNEKETLQRNL